MVGDVKTLIEVSAEELGVRLFPRPPAGFNPVGASSAELRRHGYPARPDLQLHPDRYQQWERAMSRIKTVIEPRFAFMPWIARPKLIEPPPWPPQPALSYNQAGAVVVCAANDAIEAVTGEWTVPHLATPDPAPGAYMCDTWVGIDGWGRDTQHILRVGTTQAIAPAWDFAATYGWYQLAPGPHVVITNVPFSAGDVMYTIIDTIHDPVAVGLGTVSGAYMGFGLTVPDEGRPLLGSAEWILEVPNGAALEMDGDNVASFQLADYGAVFYASSFAETYGDALVLPGDGDLITMVDADSNAISYPRLLGDNALMIWNAGEQNND